METKGEHEERRRRRKEEDEKKNIKRVVFDSGFVLIAFWYAHRNHPIPDVTHRKSQTDERMMPCATAAEQIRASKRTYIHYGRPLNTNEAQKKREKDNNNNNKKSNDEKHISEEILL